MNKRKSVVALLGVFCAFLLMAGRGTAQTPADVSGTWTLKVSGDAGNAEQTIVLKQDGGKITGTFKGPRQSGNLEGTVDGNKMKFHVNTRVPLAYTGTVDGDSMKGTMTGRGRTGDFTGTRAK